MPRCETCGNDYDKTIEIVRSSGGDRGRHVFDSFECAIQAMAPTCAHCGCRIIGHGIETATAMYCCASCAKQEGVAGAQDRV